MSIRPSKVTLWDRIWAQKAGWPKVGEQSGQRMQELGALGEGKKGVGVV